MAVCIKFRPITKTATLFYRVGHKAQARAAQVSLHNVTGRGNYTPNNLSAGAMQTVIFDLDGTLADTSGDLLAAANFCFEQMGHPELLTWPEDAATALRGGRAMLTLGLTRLGKFDQAVIDEFYPVLLQAYGASIDRFTTFYPGALQAVQDLKSAGFKVGICTNKPFALAEDLMIRMGQRALFDSLIGADSLPVRKPDPAPFFEAVRQAGGRPEKAFMIGDTLTDHSTAKAANVPSILVDFHPKGSALSQEIHALRPEAVIKSFEELPPLIARLATR